ncbi:hypothetical protein [Arthrobacter alpinus]|nr:hypothetical protein [Arthrobacter alpinus]
MERLRGMAGRVVVVGKGRQLLEVRFRRYRQLLLIVPGKSAVPAPALVTVLNLQQGLGNHWMVEPPLFRVGPTVHDVGRCAFVQQHQGFLGRMRPSLHSREQGLQLLCADGADADGHMSWVSSCAPGDKASHDRRTADLRSAGR